LFEGGGYPFIQTGDITAANLYIDTHEQEYNTKGLAQSKLWDSGTLAITIAANIAETGILSYPMCFPDSVVGFTAYDGETSELYMHYIFAYIRSSIKKSIGGSIQDNINIDYLENLDFKIPNFETQNILSSVLSALDRKIALNNRINAELEKTAKLLYDYWFVQFDFPDAEGKPYRASGGKMVYNEQLKHEIPAGWRADKLENKLNMRRGVEPGSDSYSEVVTETKTIPFIRVSDLGSTPTLYISEQEANGTFCLPSDILVAFDGSVGKMAIAMEGAYSTGMRKIEPKDSDYSNALIYFIFQSEHIQKTIAKYAVGSNILHAASAIEHLFFPYHDDTVKAFIGIVEPIYKMIVANKQENKELTALRDFLLPLLMNGQVTVAPVAPAHQYY
jgi:type I restriction enzyme S subunit